ncbi:MAG: iron-sulfur cluster carrier protein ApbC [Betaproteobacteria bacterium]|nr:iron-sulfur cluster carrier protein ApbC [Betaproteobacteria bacterium]
MAVSVEAVREKLGQVVDPWTGKDYVTGREARNIQVEGGDVSVEIVLGYPAASVLDETRSRVEAAVRELPGVAAVAVRVSQKIVAHEALRGAQRIDGVRNVIAVASGKGGVGKSTVAANLALALAHEGARVGVLDADIYGPSQPTMLGMTGKPEVVGEGEQRKFLPMRNHGVQGISIGMLIDPEQAVAWRGPMATGALQQLLRDTRWDDLDYLIVDMPPGTGDIQLTLAQKVPVTGAVIVTTPQDIALLDARRGLRMFEKVNVPIIGIVENMSIHVCSNCGHEEHVFGAGGGERMATDYGVTLLGELPLDIRIREQADAGTPTVVADPDGTAGRTYRDIARRVGVKIAELAKDSSAVFPKIVIQNT